jgi:hypothetical protein
MGHEPLPCPEAKAPDAASSKNLQKLLDDNQRVRNVATKANRMLGQSTSQSHKKDSLPAETCKSLEDHTVPASQAQPSTPTAVNRKHDSLSMQSYQSLEKDTHRLKTMERRSAAIAGRIKKPKQLAAEHIEHMHAAASFSKDAHTILEHD